MVRAKWACSLRFFLVKMSGFDRLRTKAASVMSQKMADFSISSMAEPQGKCYWRFRVLHWLVLDHVS